AMQQLFARHHVRLYRFVLRLVRDESLAEDLISEVFLDVWRQADRFERRSSVATWLLAIGRYKALSALRKKPQHAADDEQTAAIPDPAGTEIAREAGRVDAAHAQNPELARRYAMVREELAATVRLNESLGAPSSGSLQRLMRRIAAEPKTGSASRAGFSVPEWWQGLLL